MQAIGDPLLDAGDAVGAALRGGSAAVAGADCELQRLACAGQQLDLPARLPAADRHRRRLEDEHRAAYDVVEPAISQGRAVGPQLVGEASATPRSYGAAHFEHVGE